MSAEKVDVRITKSVLRRWSVMILFSTTLLFIAVAWFYFLGWGITQLQAILFAKP